MRPDNMDEGLDSQDSFLDVIANVVGVLIILVMVVGVRATYIASQEHNESASSTEEVAENNLDLAQLQDELKDARKEAGRMHEEVTEKMRRIATIARESALQDRRRIELNMHRSLVEEDIQRRRDLLDTSGQQQFDVQRAILQSQLQLDELTKAQLAIAQMPTEVEEIECVPTPLGKRVEGKEIHLRLRKGLVSIVPIDALQEEFLQQVDSIRRRLHGRNEVVETVGPINGYRLKFRARKETVTVASLSPALRQREQTYVDLHFQFLPNSDSIGQNVQQALMPRSELMRHLNAIVRQAPAVTIWAYNDSFEDLREMRRVLSGMGFPVAVRPRLPGQHIAASPRGSRSVAQ